MRRDKIVKMQIIYINLINALTTSAKCWQLSCLPLKTAMQFRWWYYRWCVEFRSIVAFGQVYLCWNISVKYRPISVSSLILPILIYWWQLGIRMICMNCPEKNPAGFHCVYDDILSALLTLFSWVVKALNMSVIFARCFRANAHWLTVSLS